jgi:methyl-accepting chemotaxis protein
VQPINVTAEYVDRIAKGDIPPKITEEYRGDFNEIKNNLNQAIDVMNGLSDEINRLIAAAGSGKLDVRAESAGFSGGWQQLVSGLNELVNAFVQPINVTAEYVDRIAKGDIPPRITDDYQGDFNEIKNNLNQAIDVMNGLSNEINRLIAAAGSGKLDVRAESADFSGGWRQLVSGLNELVSAFVQPINVTAEYVDRIAKGDIPPKITEEHQGDFNEIKNNLNQAIDVMNSLTEEINQLTVAAQAGHLDERADSARFSGGWQTLVNGLNDVIEAFATPLDEAGRVVGVMATGDLRSRMSGAYQGDFKRFEDNINSLGDALASLIEQVNQAVGQTSTSAQAITVTAENLSVSSREQTEQSDQIATAVEDMAKTITENAMNASKTAEEAESSGRIANSGGEVLQQTIRKMRDISDVVSESATSIGKLGDSSKQIGEIISVIDDIAYQTNLLALNAAIEAARAGEQGRGFSVVADEVRRLAERTGEATKQIADMIKKIQAETEDAVAAMGRGTREVDEGISLADRAGESLHEILESIQSVLNRIRQIAQASEQQSATSEQISASVTSISQVARDTAQQVDGVATTAEEMSTLTQHLGTLMARFKVMTTA